MNAAVLIFLDVVDQQQPRPAVANQAMLDRMKSKAILLSIVQLGDLIMGHFR